MYVFLRISMYVFEFTLIGLMVINGCIISVNTQDHPYNIRESHYTVVLR